jgi:D-lyxose ketol-isomerase
LRIGFEEFGELHGGHVWGYERWLVNTDLYCAKLIILLNDRASSRHYHVEKTETFIVLSGVVRIGYWEEFGSGSANWLDYRSGEWITIVAGEEHKFQAIEVPSVILEVSTHHEDLDTYRV